MADTLWEGIFCRATGDKEGLKKAKAKLNTRVQTLRAYCDDNGLKYKPDRTAVVDYKKSMAGFVPADKRKKIAEIQRKGLDISGGSGIIKTEGQRHIGNIDTVSGMHTAAGNRRSPLYELEEHEIAEIRDEIIAIGANLDDFVFNSKVTRGTCFLPSDGKVHIRGNILPDESSKHPRDRMSVRAVLAHEYYGHRPYREQYIREDNDTSPDAISRIMARQWADEFRASYMAAKNAPNLSDEDRYLLICDALSRAEEAGISIKYNDFIRRALYG